MRIHRLIAIGGAFALSLVGGLAAPALAAPANASNWHVGVYTPSGRALSEAHAASVAGGLAAFQFTTAPNTALLVTTQGSQKGTLLGDLTGKTVTATFTISGSSQFTYYGEGTSSNSCGAPASARLFFETSSAGGFDPTHYWWSNGVGFTQLANGTFTLTATIDPGQWSDYDGQFGTTAPEGFASAAANVTGIGLSFGGGCFFENGVGSAGATLTLTSFAVNG